MSIIVKGIKMPKEGCFNILYVYGDGSIRMPVWGKGLVKAEYMQASELPPHGRLIDADALRQDLKDSIDECQNWADAVEPDTTMYARISQAFGTFVECSLRVKAAPTIIPAEEDEQ